jgi:[ribosomal protein S5]-alanine N-acetyltransferase
VDGPTALRPWQDADLAAIVAACQDPEIARWTRVPADYNERHARAFLLEREEALRSGTTVPYAIAAAGDRDRLLGSMSILRINEPHRRAEVGYWLARDARGQGHATRALRLISAWGFEILGLERLELQIGVGNGPSQAVAERAGFTREALRRSYMLSARGRLDMVTFGLLPAVDRSGAGSSG